MRFRKPGSLVAVVAVTGIAACAESASPVENEVRAAVVATAPGQVPVTDADLAATAALAEGGNARIW